MLTITGTNQWLVHKVEKDGEYDFEIGGTFTGTLLLERSLTVGASWATLAAYTGPVPSATVEGKRVACKAGTWLRIGVPAGGTFSAGSAVVRFA